MSPNCPVGSMTKSISVVLCTYKKSFLENVFRSVNLEAKIINHRLGVTKMAGTICIRDMMTVIGTKETFLVHNYTNIW